MDYTILYRKYFLPPMAHIMANRIHNNIAVGINPTSPEWHVLSLKMKCKGAKCIAGDYSCFDGKAPTEGYLAACEFFKAWYMDHWVEVVNHGRNIIDSYAMDKEEFCEFLDRIFLEVVNHIHVTQTEIDGEFYRLFYSVVNGQPSGNPGTAIVNSVEGIWMMLRVWLHIMQGTEYSTVNHFYQYVYLITYGDDVAVNISDEVIGLFNQNSITRVMKELFDIDFTDECKTGNETPDFRLLSDISFLKRKFQYSPLIAMYVAPMEESILLDILNWVRTGSEDPRIITINNIASVAAELALISKETYEKWLPKLRKAYSSLSWRVDKTIVFDTWEGYLFAFRNARFKSFTDI